MEVLTALRVKHSGGQLPFQFMWIDAAEEQRVVKAFGVKTRKLAQSPQLLIMLPVQTQDPKTGKATGQIAKAFLTYDGAFDVESISAFF
eukprot:gene15617-2866_t